MDSKALEQIVDKLKAEVVQRGVTASVAIIGSTPAALDLVRILDGLGLKHRLLGIYAAEGKASNADPITQPRAFEKLREQAPDLALIASDDHKEDLLLAALPFLTAQTKVLIGGFRHFEFRDEVFEREVRNCLVPSFANGYPNSLIHIYQCMKSAARRGLKGVIAEFGMFKGGTTMLISRFAEVFGQDWKVYGFDTFDGFPPPRSALDMYAHPDCVFLDAGSVQRLFHGRNVEIVAGDIARTADILADKKVVLAFIDTDNFTPAKRVLEVITNQIVIGGSIVFDHFTGRDRFLYTLGERLAAKPLLEDERFLNLHDTGVFVRLA